MGAGMAQLEPVETLERFKFVAPLSTRRMIWLGSEELGKKYPDIARSAVRLLSLHATSCAPERNWSVWGRLFRNKDRNWLGMARTEKLIYISSKAKSDRREMKSADEQELQLLCNPVDEGAFGTWECMTTQGAHS